MLMRRVCCCLQTSKRRCTGCHVVEVCHHVAVTIPGTARHRPACKACYQRAFRSLKHFVYMFSLARVFTFLYLLQSDQSVLCLLYIPVVDDRLQVSCWACCPQGGRRCMLLEDCRATQVGHAALCMNSLLFLPPDRDEVVSCSCTSKIRM